MLLKILIDIKDKNRMLLVFRIDGDDLMMTLISRDKAEKKHNGGDTWPNAFLNA